MTQASAPDLTRRPRTRRVFPPDDMERMAALYYDPGVPLTQVAPMFDVPVSTFLRWIAEMDWPRRSAVGLRASAPEPPAPGGSAAALTGSGAPRKPARVKPAPDLFDTLMAVSEITRRELGAVARMQPASMAERERLARLLASLTRSMDRVEKSLVAETERLLRDEEG